MNRVNKDYLKRTQKDYSLGFKLPLVDEVEKGLLMWKQSQKNMVFRTEYRFGWVRKTRNFGLKSKTPMKRKSHPKRISGCRKKIKLLAAEK